MFCWETFGHDTHPDAILTHTTYPNTAADEKCSVTPLEHDKELTKRRPSL